MIRLLLAALLSCASCLSAIGAENSLWLHNGELETRVPADWTIIAHQPSGVRTVAAFQLFENEAEKGTEQSTNLSIATFYLKDIEATMAFIEPLSKELEEGENDSEFESWALREWGGGQGEVEYRIVDARLTHHRLGVGIHVRLAWPLLAANAKDYDAQMKTMLESLLSEIVERNPGAEEKKDGEAEKSTDEAEGE